MNKTIIVLLLGLLMSGCANNQSQFSKAMADRQILCPNCDNSSGASSTMNQQNWFYFGMTNGNSFASPTVIVINK